MSSLDHLSPREVEFLKKLIRHKDRGLLSLGDCVEAIVADHNVTPSVAERMLDEAKSIMSSSS
jgi:hypothetical protein